LWLQVHKLTQRFPENEEEDGAQPEPEAEALVPAAGMGVSRPVSPSRQSSRRSRARVSQLARQPAGGGGE
jgi:hypothetical protein